MLADDLLHVRVHKRGIPMGQIVPSIGQSASNASDVSDEVDLLVLVRSL